MSTSTNLVLTTISLLKGALLHRCRDPSDRTGDRDVEGKVAVVTGGNRGIGKEAVMELAKRGAIVVMACRDVVKGQQLIDLIKKETPTAQLILVKLDLTDLGSVRDCAREICVKFPAINLLINNAGVMSINPAVERTKDGLEQHFAINHLGHFLLTLLLLKNLQKGSPSRVVCVSSNAWQMSELNLDDMNMEKDQRLGAMNLRAYSNSKLCNMLFAKELAKRLAGTQIRTYSLCPGYINSGLYDDWPGVMGTLQRVSVKACGISEKHGIETILYCSLAAEIGEESGRPYHLRKLWPEAERRLNEDGDEGVKVWEISEKFTNIKFEDVF